MPEVAPHAGAWIETEEVYYYRDRSFVAPHAGAWIETYSEGECPDFPPSPPMRGRGLKPSSFAITKTAFCRPPCGGVD